MKEKSIKRCSLIIVIFLIIMISVNVAFAAAKRQSDIGVLPPDSVQQRLENGMYDVAFCKPVMGNGYKMHQLESGGTNMPTIHIQKMIGSR